MDREARFWLSFWAVTAMTLVTVMAIIGISGTINDTYRYQALQEMVKGGANPMAAACALEGRNRSDSEYPLTCARLP